MGNVGNRGNTLASMGVNNVRQELIQTSHAGGCSCSCNTWKVLVVRKTVVKQPVLRTAYCTVSVLSVSFSVLWYSARTQYAI